jgi:hypothetical protein
MYIKIKKYQEGITKGINTSVFGKNTDDLIIKIVGSIIQVSQNQKSGKKTYNLGLNIQSFNYDILINEGEQYASGDIFEFADKLNNIVITKDFKLTAINSVKRLVEELKKVYDLTDNDYEILSEPVWRHEEMNFRITISDKKLKEPMLFISRQLLKSIILYMMIPIYL